MSNLKDYIILFLVVAVLTMLLLLTCKHKPVVQDVAVANPDSTQYWKGKFDQEVASQRAKPNDFSGISSRVLDSIARGYNTTRKQIQSLLILAGNSHGNLKPDSATRILIDSSAIIEGCPPVPSAMLNTFHTPYYDLDVQLGEDQHAYVTHRDTLTSIWKRIKTGNFLNKTEYLQIDNSLADTGSHVTGMKTYRVPVYKNIWGIILEGKTLVMSADAVYGMGAAGFTKETPLFKASILGGRAQRIDGQRTWYAEARISTTIPLKKR